MNNIEEKTLEEKHFVKFYWRKNYLDSVQVLDSENSERVLQTINRPSKHLKKKLSLATQFYRIKL